jgi:hypothetical protein
MSVWPFSIAPPREPFEVGAGPSNQCKIDHTEVYIYIPARSIRVDVFLNSCYEKTYNAYVLIPFVVSNITCSAYTISDKALTTTFSFRNVTECNACIANSTFYSEEVSPELKVEFLFTLFSDLVQNDLFGSLKAVAMTFFGPQSDLLYNKTYQYHGKSGNLAISSPFIVHLNLPPGTTFSSESFPVPIQQYMRNDQTWIMFDLVFPNNNYAQTITCYFVNTIAQGIKQVTFLFGSFFLGIATTLIVEFGLHEAGINKNRNEFWKLLLGKSNAKTTLFANVSPNKGSTLLAGAGVDGLHYDYVILENEARIQLTIESGDSAKNKSIFDNLHSKRDQIEHDFEDQLVWNRLDGKKSSKISKIVANKGLKDVKEWPRISDEMVDLMCRFERALSKHISR